MIALENIFLQMVRLMVAKYREQLNLPVSRLKKEM
jgi:DNA-directed RNA polymerase specialized sigma54-like protein